MIGIADIFTDVAAPLLVGLCLVYTNYALEKKEKSLGKEIPG